MVPAGVSKSSTASTPTTSSSTAIRMASSCATTARSSSRPGAGASTSTHMPSRCTVSTTGYAATCPNGDRATIAASSRRSGTFSSTMSSSPWSSSGFTATGSESTQTPRPSYPPVTVFTTHEPSSMSAAEETGRQAGTGTPSSDRRSRMARLFCAYSRASADGSTVMPSASRARMCEPGTCSWSNVTTSQSLAKARSASRSVCAPMTVSAATRAAPSSGEVASTRSDWPSAIAAWWVIRASWPPPTMPTTGRPVLESIGVSLVGRPPRHSAQRASQPLLGDRPDDDQHHAGQRDQHRAGDAALDQQLDHLCQGDHQGDRGAGDHRGPQAVYRPEDDGSDRGQEHRDPAPAGVLAEQHEGEARQEPAGQRRTVRHP